MPFSHHSHSGQFCAHAKNTLEEMVQAAISRGFETFALTEHIPRDNDDLYPEEERESLGSLTTLFDAYYQEAVRLRELYASEIRILIGFETEWIRPRSLEIINELLDRYQFDLFIGSVHHVHTVPIDFDRDLYEKSRANSEDCDEKLAERYFDDQHDMLQILKPPVVGHLDLIRLFSDNKHVEFKRWETVWNRINRNLDFIASYGGLLELNSSAFRKGMKTPYPEADICKASK
ncbi:histidinol phosphate phosphatase H [Patellaria atrata CBS 101060]|uniref:Histidinol-phosphatase n=1 Tax=Patellaria atrata CBS 101060 TaxID=1346257 RepID=A0A9P4VNU3_9PEZI|nr:histidinol phosphate phosphatase H [Patellaria atrata CBS 101060]